MTGTVRNYHALLIAALVDEEPHIILGPADSADVVECMEHLEKVLFDAVARYVVCVLNDLNNSNPTKPVDVAAFRAGLIDLVGDTISGPLMRIAEQLDEDETESRERRGSNLMAGE